VLDRLDAAEVALDRQRRQLTALRLEVERMLRVYEAAKRYVLTATGTDVFEDGLMKELEDAVHAAVSAEPKQHRPAPTRTPGAGTRRSG
jgi:hypothetical protein